MAKKDEFDLEFDFEKELNLDAEDLLKDDTQMEALDLEEDSDAEASAYTSVGDDDELDFLNDEFLASLGIIVEDDEEEELSPEEPEEAEELLEEIQEPEEAPAEEEDIVDALAEDYEDDYDESCDYCFEGCCADDERAVRRATYRGEFDDVFLEEV